MNSWRRQSGQSMVEYVIVVSVLVVALLMPLPDNMAKVSGDSAVESLERAFRDNYRGYSYAISMSEYPDYQAPEALSDLADSAQKGGELMVQEFLEFPVPIGGSVVDEPGFSFGDVADFLGF